MIVILLRRHIAGLSPGLLCRQTVRRRWRSQNLVHVYGEVGKNALCDTQPKHFATASVGRVCVVLRILPLQPCVVSKTHRWSRQMLKAVEAKSKEELDHERAREPLAEAVGDARVRKQIHDHRLGTLLQSRDAYMKTKK